MAKVSCLVWFRDPIICTINLGLPFPQEIPTAYSGSSFCSPLKLFIAYAKSSYQLFNQQQYRWDIHRSRHASDGWLLSLLAFFLSIIMTFRLMLGWKKAPYVVGLIERH